MIIDYFPYFNERELLELRIKLLLPHVDHFVICEADQSFSGLPRSFCVPELIQELGLPKNRITVVQLNVPSDQDLPLEAHDITSQYPEDRDDLRCILSTARDRAQRNGLLQVIDQFATSDLVIISDCDEIINPDHLGWAVHTARSNPDAVIKLPLVNLYGRADLRPFRKDGTPYYWRTAMSLCRVDQVQVTTPHRIRCEHACPWPCVKPTLDGQIFDEFGWHFSWQGGDQRVQIKSRSYGHAFNQGHQAHAQKGFRFESGHSLAWDEDSVLMPFGQDQLPQIIFDLPRVRDFLLP